MGFLGWEVRRAMKGIEWCCVVLCCVGGILGLGLGFYVVRLIVMCK